MKSLINNNIDRALLKENRASMSRSYHEAKVRKYRHGRAESAEYLRMAIAEMGKHSAAMNPITYAVWYEHASGMNNKLSKKVHEAKSSGNDFNDEIVSDLYINYVLGEDELAIHNAGENLDRLIVNISDSASAVSDRAGEFSGLLKEVSESPESIEKRINDLISQSNAMISDTEILRKRLDESRAEIAALREELAKAREESAVDGLTGLVNRRRFDIEVESLLSDGANQDACLLILDIDYFKKINDTYGHVFGDKVIRSVANTLKENVKGKDVVARYGGEEFAILLYELGINEAYSVAETIRKSVERMRIRRIGSDSAYVGNISISIGVTAKIDGDTYESFISRADEALYHAKKSGRNRTKTLIPLEAFAA